MIDHMKLARAAAPIVTFDAGQTLVELDLAFLAKRLAERGVSVTQDALRAAAPDAWAVNDRELPRGVEHAWHALMSALLGGGGVAPGAIADTVAWLWREQPRVNLWRQPIGEMVALARELAAQGARVAVLSNSEGRLAELLAEVGIADAFATIVDSGRCGIAKPDRRIFEHVLAELGVAPADAGVPIHIGDAWAADVVGAREAGWRAVWFSRHASVCDDPGVAVAREPADARAALVRWGALAIE
jgi:putative hydrolase of the HAD superfamily